MRAWIPGLMLVALIALYAVVRPGIWPWMALIALVAGAAWLAYRSAPSVRVERAFSSSRTFAGSPVEVRVTLHIRTIWPMLLTVVERPPRTVIPDRPAALTGLFWGSSQHELMYRVTPNSRGGFVWPGLEVNWSDPLGLFVRDARTQTLADSGFELLVYPGTHPLELPDLTRPLISDGPPSRTWGLEDPSTFAGVRAYAPGDPQRRIHWRQTARFGTHNGRYNQLIVRELERVAATGVIVHLDLDANGRQADIYLESVTRLAASLVQNAFELGLRIGVSSLTGASEYGGGFAALERALAYLALVKLEPDAIHLDPTRDVPLPPPSTNLVILTMHAPARLIEGAIRARSRAARVIVIAMPEGFYLEPGESPRPLWVSPPDTIRDLQARAGVLEEAGVRVIVLRGDDSVLKLAYR